MTSSDFSSSVYVVDGSRTPFLKARGRPGLFSATDLAVSTCRSLLLRQPFSPSDIGCVVTGCVMPSQNEANIARLIALRSDCGFSVPAYTVQRNCASGLQAIDSAAKDISLGRYNLALAGGTEAMSQAPLLWRPELVDWLGAFRQAPHVFQKIKLLSKLRPHYFKPIIALLSGLSDPFVNLSMGQTAENISYRFGITRKEMDQFSLESHHRLAHAVEQGYLSEITPLYDDSARLYEYDDGLRRDASLEKLSGLNPFFDKPFGSVTAGNSSQVSDGAAFLILANPDAIRRYHLPVLGRVIDIQWGALDPAEMGLGPVYASAALLRRHQLTLEDIDYWEINEAFAGQVLACLRAFEDKQYCQQYLGMKEAIGRIDQNRVNIDGGAIALGHPVGASGARLPLHLLHILRRQQAKLGIATLCIGGGQGGAILLEQTTELVS